MKIYFQFKRHLAKCLTNIEFKQQQKYLTDYVIAYLRKALHCRCRIHVMMTLHNFQSSLLRLAKDNWLFQTTKGAKPLFQLTTYIVAVMCGDFAALSGLTARLTSNNLNCVQENLNSLL